MENNVAKSFHTRLHPISMPTNCKNAKTRFVGFDNLVAQGNNRYFRHLKGQDSLAFIVEMCDARYRGNGVRSTISVPQYTVKLKHHGPSFATKMKSRNTFFALPF